MATVPQSVARHRNPANQRVRSPTNIADYTVWADQFLQTGHSYSTGDFTGDGLVDTADYRVWADNIAPAQLSFAAVPEPSTAALAGIVRWGYSL